MLVKARYKGAQVTLWPVLVVVQILRSLKVGD